MAAAPTQQCVCAYLRPLDECVHVPTHVLLFLVKPKHNLKQKEKKREKKKRTRICTSLIFSTSNVVHTHPVFRDANETLVFGV